MKNYCKFLFIVIILLINLGFIITFIPKHEVSVELIQTGIIDNASEIEVPQFEIKTMIISNSCEPCLVAYGGQVNRFEYSPLYIFTDDWYLLRDRWRSDTRTIKGSFFYTHPYYIEFENVPNKIFIYRLPPAYFDISGHIHLMQ